MAQFELVVLELDFCVPERAGMRAALNDTDGMDEIRNSRRPHARAIARLVEVVRRGSGRPCQFARRPGVRIAHIGDVDAPEVGRIARDFRKRGEENGTDLSV
jgi:hypothetical protein